MQNLWSLTKEAMPFIGPLASGLVAAFLMHFLTKARDREARKAERESLIDERRKEFRRDALLALQDEMMRYMKATRKAHGAESADDRPTEVSNALILARDRILVLKVRVRDKKINEQLDDLDSLCLGSAHYLKLNDETRKNAMKKANQIYDALNQMIGDELATLDTFE